jgi:protein-disulfide isomerase
MTQIDKASVTGRIAGRAKVVLEVVTSLALCVAAVALTWRLVSRPSQSDSVPSGAERPMERIESQGLATSIRGAAVKGSTKAPIVLIEFSDFECPFCGQYANDTLPKIEQEFVDTGRIQYAFRNYPLGGLHKFAFKAAQAGECAGRQGKFWEMHEGLFANQAQLADSIWLREAKTVGLDADAFERCVNEPGDKIRLDFDEGTRLGVVSTPTFLVGRLDGETVRLVGRIRGAQPFAVFEEGLHTAMALQN